MKMKNLLVAAFVGLSFAALTAVASSAATGPVQEPSAGSCWKIPVEGCGKKMNICVSTGGSATDAQKAAKEAFKKATGCKSAKSSGYAGCGNKSKCDKSI